MNTTIWKKYTINFLVTDSNLTITENGIYTGSGNLEDDTFSFMAIAGIIVKQEWMKYASEWSWYENSDDPENLLETFEILR